MILLYRLHTAHLEWLGIRKTLKGQEYRHFVRWLCHAHPDLVPHDLAGLTFLRQQCREIQRGSAPPTNRDGLNMTTLKRHAPAITSHYLALPAPRSTFAEFLERVLKECPTEDALRRFLGASSTPPPTF